MTLPLVVDFKNAVITQSGLPILKDVNFNMVEAEHCYIVGKSGSGKSSLLKAIYAEAKLSHGDGRVLNFDVKTIKRTQVPELRRRLGMVFQDFYLFKNWTVAHNLSFVMVATDWRDKARIKSRVEEVLEHVGLLHYFNTKVHQLSGGEQQRLAIARAIINKPEIIIADEPTGNLDPDTADEILYLLNRLSKENKSAMVLATHDYRLIEKFPARIYRCEDGMIIPSNL
ncbi:MAG: Cell division ATP-binding protein FtsE [Bacteroidota bacterium]